MNSYSLTYSDAQLICKQYNNKNFFEKVRYIDGYKVSLFDYFICDHKDFANPIPNSNINAFEMRGVTFIFNPDSFLYKRYLMLPKFFNINQTESTFYKNLKNKKIHSVTSKEDGSLIGFMRLPTGKLFSKTIGGYDNEQSIDSLKLLDTQEKIDWINNCINLNYTPLFEYVSLQNRIVLKYNYNSELILIGIRHNETGQLILSPSDSPFNTVKQFNEYSLIDLTDKAKYEENKEGWVVQFEDGQLVKIKTDWYFKLHYIRTDNIFREDYVIEMYLNEKLDDLISQLDTEEDTDAFTFINNVKQSVDNFMTYIYNYTYIYKLIFINIFKSDKINFAKNYKNVPFFNFIINRIDLDIESFHQKLVEMIIFKNSRLNKAREFIEKWNSIK